MREMRLSRRHFAGWLGASTLASGISSRSRAEWDNVETPPVFTTIPAPALTPIYPNARLFSPADVKLLASPFLQAQGANAAYIRRLDTDRLLHTFRVNAGLPSSATPLGGWEAPDCELRGHFVGHYLSGSALAFVATRDPEFKQRGDRVVVGLAECQKKLGDDGYLSAFPRSYFDRLAAGTNVWAPFYTIHKIFAGLLDMYELAGNERALDLAKGIANWTDAWTGARDELGMQKVLEVEFGGMNDALYRLAAITGDRRWLAVGDRFTKKRVFEPLAGQKDMLRGLHMNTHVPQVIGAERRYELTGDHRFADVSQFFWQTVTGIRTYATGGSSNNEHWLTEPHQLGVEWAASHDHQECCCSYNMLKLGTMLFTRNPRASIADYYERALLNHRLGEIRPETGNTSYFLSLAPGAWKTWGTDDTTFWCCNGTALEDFSSFNRMIYAHDKSGIWVNLFIPSHLHWADRGVHLRQETAFPAEPRTSLVVEASSREPWTLRLRNPRWASGTEVKVNG
ncbi:MAG TPA: beta-L-arabinofuranosidase domain-containing protein, partial [Sphingomicrobium sp.]|nr:beta-L-arabinofuranosidase domain-containing protein [Sphingomicrobium sp.]